MIRAFAIAAAALPLLGAAPASFVDYRVTLAPTGALAVDMRLAGEPDGETQLRLPPGAAATLKVSGAGVDTVGDVRTLRHKPGAGLRIRYTVGGGPEVAALGEAVFAEPVGWDALSAGVRWSKLPKGWRVASDLDHAGLGRPLTVGDVRRSVLVAGPAIRTAEQTTPGGVIRAATLADDRDGPEKLAAAVAPAVAAVRSYLGEPAGPFFVTRAAAPERGLDRDDGFVAPPSGLSDAELRRALVEAHVDGVLERQAGRAPAKPAPWLTGGLGRFVTDRALVRAGAMSADDWVGRWVDTDASTDAAARGAILALKWDDDVRRKTGGKADLDDVVQRMRDHYRRFAPGQGPDTVTGLISAVWVTAGLDIRPDIARYAEGNPPIPLPDELFGGCILARVTVSPGFDAGFDTTRSFASRTVAGVRRRGPAWNSGVRDGMRLESWTFSAGDRSRQIELLVRLPKMSSKARPRRIAYWPYGDNDTSVRKIQFLPDLTREQVSECARRIAGL
ncbi:MAG: hypothetical protein JNL41_10660 [Phenylobacterium sp.]|uniref:hypothetical protein n=1 Tax=Phenylobacterium sp. TaxID=1871053 RepID=UPI001A466DE7|nr:hypothetical protein [Phenylobacterium sp.]MBL8554729.1 hypothetical protein [Phenylobacterium sp.]